MKLHTIALSAALLAAACAPEHSARQSLDWDGSYFGTLQCKHGLTDTRLTLSEDGTYHMWTMHKGDPLSTNREEGRFSWDWAGNEITLRDGGKPKRYHVTENALEVLNKKGKKREGAVLIKK